MSDRTALVVLLVALIVLGLVLALVAIDRNRHRAIAYAGFDVNIALTDTNRRLEAALIDSIDNTRAAMELVNGAREALRIVNALKTISRGCITIRPGNVSIAGRLGDDTYVYGEGPDMSDAYVEFIHKARAAAGA